MVSCVCIYENFGRRSLKICLKALATAEQHDSYVKTWTVAQRWRTRLWAVKSHPTICSRIPRIHQRQFSNTQQCCVWKSYLRQVGLSRPSLVLGARKRPVLRNLFATDCIGHRTICMYATTGCRYFTQASLQASLLHCGLL